MRPLPAHWLEPLGCLIQAGGEAMKRRSKAGGKAGKSARHKAPTLKLRRTPPKEVSGRRSATTTQEREIARLTHERDEALEQQTATSDVLQVISSSPGDLEPVFTTILENATRICEAKFGNVYLWDDDAFCLVAAHNTPPAFAESRKRAPFRPNPGHPFRNLAETKEVFHIADVAALPGYAERDPQIVEPVELGGIRTCLGVPVLKDNGLIGALVMFRQEVCPFTDKQIELLKNFASQAVIAIENARLLNELRQRTDELETSLEYQTATSDVLKVVSGSVFDLQQILKFVAETAARLCAAKQVGIFLLENNVYRFNIGFGLTPAYREIEERAAIRPGPETVVGRVALHGESIHILDVLSDPEYGPKDDVRTANVHTVLAVPLTRESKVVGVIVLARETVSAFGDEQIELVRTFADQAVIAIENARLLNELRQSLEQQTATSAVLQVISSSPGELDPVFRAMLANATRICEAKFGNLYLYAEGAFRLVASDSSSAELASERLGGPLIYPAPGTGLGRMLSAKAAVQIADVLTDENYPSDHPLRSAAEREGVRTLLCVPMTKEDDLVGAIVIFRQEVRPFTNKQIELVKNFAAQAVIAIENARLLNELRQSLEEQTATSEVLQVISTSPGDLRRTFATMLEKATRICEAKFGTLYLAEGNGFRTAAHHNAPPAYQEARTGLIHPHPDTTFWHAANTKQSAQILDTTLGRAYIEGDPFVTAAVAHGGYRSVLSVPMLHEDKLVGVISIFRQEVRSFTEKQIALVQNFAAQAVIAIENARLLNELRESLQRQTATADVLKVISRSTFDLQTVLDTLTESAAKLCAADNGVIFQRDANVYRFAANYRFSPEAVRYALEHPLSPSRSSMTGRVALEGRPIHIPDVMADPEYGAADYQQIFGYRTNLGVPLLREGATIGVFSLTRNEVKPFTAEQIELVSTFADQAVIAIENARLLSELRESLQQQTATADVLKVISRSAFDLQTVLDTLLQTAARLCNADQGTITQRKGDAFYRSVSYGFPATFAEYVKDRPVELGRDTATGRALLEGKVIHIPDVQADPEYTWKEAQRLGGFRTLLGVPMLREGLPMGVLTLTRIEARPFTEKQIELVSTFADQAAIAIENVRLFESVEARTRELVRSLDDLRAAQDRLVQTQKLASLGQLTAGIAHEIKNPLNFVNNFSGVSVDLIGELQEALQRVQADDRTRSEISELADTLRDNLGKIVQHGRRADAIVKNMLLHSREGSGEHRPVDINAIVEEALNLAYHGARAEKQDFTITLQRSFDPEAGQADVFPQDITRVLLNLISNSFYAATKRKATIGSEGFQPTVAAVTRSLGDRVEIRIRDNGTGILPEVKEKMFNPFFTTKPAGEGTGLGLSISYDIVVKRHAGSIEVDTQPGEFTEIRIILARSAAHLSEERA
jgi:GAF domain-containing protein